LFECFRWKLDSNGKDEINPKSKKKILQFVTIQRLDTGEWAIPGVKYKTFFNKIVPNTELVSFFMFLQVKGFVVRSRVLLRPYESLISFLENYRRFSSS